LTLDVAMFMTLFETRWGQAGLARCAVGETLTSVAVTKQGKVSLDPHWQ